uniref:Uncharacterized protein n=1 Tax=Oncorhynchus tshawytscha TaxID=74940 RepID=A0A8C8JY11_ONCTS
VSVLEELLQTLIAFAHDSRVLQCLIQFGNDKNIVKKFLMYGCCVTDALSVVEYAYNKKAILRLIEELYRTTFQVFKVRTPPTPLPLHCSKVELMAFEEIKLILTPMATKEAVIKHSLVQSFSGLYPACPRCLLYMAHTHDGAKVAMHCLWHGTPKDRKVIIKTMKTYIRKFAMVSQHNNLIATV